METPAMLSEMGNSSTLASLAEPPGPNQPLEFSRSYLKLWRGEYFSRAAACTPGVASKEAAARDAPPSSSRRVHRRALPFSCLIILPPGNVRLYCELQGNGPLACALDAHSRSN